MRQRRLSLLDRFISETDAVMRTITNRGHSAGRASPADGHTEGEMSERERQHVAGLMRVNHVGEICAQALYQSQALTARDKNVREQMKQSAAEETDHLAWCEQRIEELGGRKSLLNPLWYAGSFAIGAAAGLAGDGWSLGFLKETEKQVEAHLEGHLEKLPPEDARSRAILDQMKVDEAKHAQMAEDSGAADLPKPVKDLMKLTADLMKAIAYRV